MIAVMRNHILGFLIASISWSVLAHPSSACIMRVTPIEANDLSGVVMQADEIAVAEVICETCENETFVDLEFRFVRSGASVSINGYIFEHLDNAPNARADFFEPWAMWASPPEGCMYVPVVRAGELYDVATKDDEIIWVGPHSGNFISRGLDRDDTLKLSSLFLWELASDLFRNADLYWTCDSGQQRKPFLSDAKFNSYDVPLQYDKRSGHATCIGEHPARGFMHLDGDGRVSLFWGIINGRVWGTVLDSPSSDVELRRYLNTRINSEPY